MSWIPIVAVVISVVGTICIYFFQLTYYRKGNDGYLYERKGLFSKWNKTATKYYVPPVK